MREARALLSRYGINIRIAGAFANLFYKIFSFVSPRIGLPFRITFTAAIAGRRGAVFLAFVGANDELEPEIFAFPDRTHELDKVRERVDLLRLLLYLVKSILNIRLDRKRIRSGMYEITAPHFPLFRFCRDAPRIIKRFNYLYPRILRVYLRFDNSPETGARPYEEVHLTFERCHLERRLHEIARRLYLQEDILLLRDELRALEDDPHLPRSIAE